VSVLRSNAFAAFDASVRRCSLLVFEHILWNVRRSYRPGSERRSAIFFRKTDDPGPPNCSTFDGLRRRGEATSLRKKTLVAGK